MHVSVCSAGFNVMHVCSVTFMYLLISIIWILKLAEVAPQLKAEWAGLTPEDKQMFSDQAENIRKQKNSTVPNKEVVVAKLHKDLETIVRIFFFKSIIDIQICLKYQNWLRALLTNNMSPTKPTFFHLYVGVGYIGVI